MGKLLRRHRLFCALLATALAATALLLPAGAAAIDRTVSVGASATLKVPNDTATVGLSVSRERRTRGAALRAASSKLSAVIAAAQAIPGVGPGDVRTGRVSIEKRRRGTATVFRASQGIGVTLHEPARAGELVAAAISAGANGVSGPNFFVGDSEAAYARALAAAFAKAQVKAAALATQAGGVLGPALAITEGEESELLPQSDAKAAPAPVCSGPQPVAATKRERGRCAAPPTKPGTSTVTASVRVIFALE